MSKFFKQHKNLVSLSIGLAFLTSCATNVQPGQQGTQPISIAFYTSGGSTVQLATYNPQDQFALPVSQRTGYSFDGWFLNQELSQEATESSIKNLNTSGQVILYAKWTPIVYSIDYVLNQGTNSSLNPAVYSADISDFYLGVPRFDGHVFRGWYLDSTFSGNPVQLFDTEFNRNVELFAKWEKAQYSLSFISNGGSPVQAIVGDFESSVSAPLNPVREGFSFAGWYLDETLNQPYTISTIPSSNVILYAKWDRVAAEGNIGSSIPSSGGNVTVIPPLTPPPVIVYASEIIITSPKNSFYITEQLQLTAQVLPLNADNKDVRWSVQPLVSGEATIDSFSGRLTPISIGTVTVTASNNVSGVVKTFVVTILSEDGLIEEYDIADNADLIKVLLDNNELRLNLANYSSLDARGKLEVGYAILGASKGYNSTQFVTKQNIQNIATPAIADAKVRSDVRVVLLNSLKPYIEATTAAQFVNLLDANAIAITASLYARYTALDAQGKEAIGTALLAVGSKDTTWITKAALETALTTALNASTNAIPVASEERIRVLGLVNDLAIATTQDQAKDLLVRNGLGLNLIRYNSLDVIGKNAVATSLASATTFGSKDVIQTALNAAVNANIVASDARILEASRVKAFVDETTAANVIARLDINALGLNNTAYLSLTKAAKTTVATAIAALTTEQTKASLQTLLDSEVAAVQSASNTAMTSLVTAFAAATTAADIDTIITANDEGLILTDYTALGVNGKLFVREQLAAATTFASKAAIQTSLNNFVELGEIINTYSHGTAAEIVTALAANSTVNDLVKLTGDGVDLFATLSSARKTAAATLLAAVSAGDMDTKIKIQNQLLLAVNEAFIVEVELAATAADIVVLLNGNPINLTLTNYNSLTAAGKTTVGEALDGTEVFNDKADLQTDINTAVSAAQSTSDSAMTSLVTAFAAATTAAGINTILGTNAEGLILTGYNDLDDTAKLAVRTALADATSFASKLAIQTALNSEVALVKAASDVRKVVAVYAKAAADTVVKLRTTIDANVAELVLTSYNELDNQGKNDVASFFLGANNNGSASFEFTNKAEVQNVLTNAVLAAKPGSDARRLALTDAYKNATNGEAITNLVAANPNILSLDKTKYADAISGDTHSVALNSIRAQLNTIKSTFTSKAIIQAALDQASDLAKLEKGYGLAADAPAYEALLTANLLGLDLADYNVLSATRKTAVATTMNGLTKASDFNNKAAIQTAVDNAIVARLVVEYDTDAVVGALLANNELGLDLLRYSNLSSTRKTVINTRFDTLNGSLSNKAGVQTALNNAIDFLFIKEYDDAQALTGPADINTINTLAAQNTAKYDLTGYSLLDVDGKETFGTIVDAATITAGTTTVAQLQTIFTGAITDSELIQQYRNATTAQQILDLIAVDTSGKINFTLTSFNLFDSAAKTAVANGLVAATFVTKANLQTALNTAVTAAQTAFDTRFNLWEAATTAAQILTEITANAVGLDLTAYNLLDDEGKLAVRTAIAAAADFNDSSANSFTVLKTAFDAAVVEAGKVKTFREANSVANMIALLNATDLVLTTGAGRAAFLTRTNIGQIQAATNLLAANAETKFANTSALNTVLNGALALADNGPTIGDLVTAIEAATTAAGIDTIFIANEIGLDLSKYNLLDSEGKLAVRTAIAAETSLNDKAAIQTALNADILIADGVKKFSDATTPAILKTLLADAATEFADLRTAISLAGGNYGTFAGGSAASDDIRRDKVVAHIFGTKTRFANTAAIQTALGNAATAIGLEDAASLFSKYVLAANDEASDYVTLLNANAALNNGFDFGNPVLADYGNLDADGKTFVGQRLLDNKSFFISKASIENILIAAVRDARVGQAARLKIDSIVQNTGNAFTITRQDIIDSGVSSALVLERNMQYYQAAILAAANSAMDTVAEILAMVNAANAAYPG